MWHWTFYIGVRPKYDDLLHFASARDQAFRVQQSPSNSSRPVTPVPGESSLSSSVSINYSTPLTKPESIIETPTDSDCTLNLGQLINEEFVPNLSNNCSQCVQNFNSPTDLQSSVTKPHPQTQSIIKDIMLDHSFKDSNPEAKCLQEKEPPC